MRINRELKKMWAPWRSQYVVKTFSGKDCVLCINPKMSKKSMRKRYVLKCSKKAFAILNLYPYNPGHIMIAPYKHLKDFERLSPDTLSDMMDLTKDMVRRLKKSFKPAGINIGMNLGKAAGAGIADHLHMHIVPRWNGDTSFMTTNVNVRVLSQSMAQIYRSLMKEA